MEKQFHMDIPLTSMAQLLPFPTAQKVGCEKARADCIRAAEHDGS
jgi:hypothetical protein